MLFLFPVKALSQSWPVRVEVTYKELSVVKSQAP